MCYLVEKFAPEKPAIAESDVAEKVESALIVAEVTA